EGPGAGRFEQDSAPRIAVVGRLGLGIGDLNRLLRRRHPSERGPRIGVKHWIAPPLLGEGSWGIMQRDVSKRAILEEKHAAELGVANSCRVLQHGPEHGLKLARRA